ncbi:proline dehydrogenase family protein [Ferviditalea candida]|uniref:proline dehydrogenase n=1 Tax=Ferviditalea candida TaxID=3108399 RepID=A0ABU5ZGS4_9BACL|nr:proline dehydrogenase family protein [Paenibacillaceae bacterium T2]
MEPLWNSLFLYLSRNRMLNAAAKKWGLRFGAAQIVAGTTIAHAVAKVKELNAKGLVCTLDPLGEFVMHPQEATDRFNTCINTIKAIAESGVNSNLSLKLTSLGLDIDRELCRAHLQKIVETAKQHGIFVRVDMEDSPHCQPTLDLLRELRREYDNVGTVIQAYLFRSMQDVKELKGVPLRLVKGAYKESPEIAYQQKMQIDKNYLNLIRQHMSSGSHTAIATHDHRIIAAVKDLVKQHQIPRSQFEFQMLYGFRTELQQAIAGEGYTMRIYVPFGRDWFGYFMRRLAERPQNAAFAFRGLFLK